MTDDPLPYGLGWLESPPDERDWGVRPRSYCLARGILGT